MTSESENEVEASNVKHCLQALRHPTIPRCPLLCPVSARPRPGSGAALLVTNNDTDPISLHLSIRTITSHTL